jgi:hypothetical protein
MTVEMLTLCLADTTNATGQSSFWDMGISQTAMKPSPHGTAALLADVPRYQTLSGNMLPEDAVLAALSRALIQKGAAR